MKKQILFVAVFSVSAAIFGQETIAHWDFSKGSIDSVDGKYKAAVRGTTKLIGEEGKKVLNIGMTEKGEGIRLAKKYPELTPKGAFRIEAKVALREQTSKRSTLIIWDNNYIMDASWGKHKTNPDSKKGFCLYIARGKKGELRPNVILGRAENYESVYGNLITVEEDVPFTIAFEYDGNKEFSFFFNGKLNRKGKTKFSGSLATAFYDTVIGDRVGSTFNRFDGTIYEVKLIDLTQKK